MPEQDVELDKATQAALEEVCEQQGLESREQAAEFLIRRRIRLSAIELTGRGRALYVVNNQEGAK